MIEDLVGEIGQKEMRKAAEPRLGFRPGNGFPDEVPGNAFAAVASDENLLDGENAARGEAAPMSLGIEKERRGGVHGNGSG